MRTTGRRPVRRAATCLSLLGVLAAVGCGGSSGDDDDQSTASEGSATVSTSKVSGYGTVLATKGRSLYVLTSDPAGGSTCTAACAIKWHPLTAAGQATAAAGVDPSKLGSFKRDDGTEQILYNNRALYTYTRTGLASGVGVKSEGGTWYLVSPAGKPITTTASGGY